MQDHPGFNGFLNPLRQPGTRGVAATNIMSDVELVRDQAGTLTAQAAVRHTELFAGILTRAITQRKAVHTVNLPGKQTVLRFAEHQFAIKENFTQATPDSSVSRREYRYGGHKPFSSFTSSTCICQPSWLVMVSPWLNITRSRGITACVQTVFTSRWEK